MTHDWPSVLDREDEDPCPYCGSVIGEPHAWDCPLHAPDEAVDVPMVIEAAA